MRETQSSLNIQPGDKIRNGTLFRITENGTHDYVETNNLFAGKRVVIFMGPAPFSKLDTEQAISYEDLSNEMLVRVDMVVGIYCQDAFVMDQFKIHIHSKTATKNVDFWGDGDGQFARYNEMLHDFTNMGLGTRSGRWSMVIDDGIVEYIACDDFTEINLTSAQETVDYLNEAEI